MEDEDNSPIYGNVGSLVSRLQTVLSKDIDDMDDFSDTEEQEHIITDKYPENVCGGLIHHSPTVNVKYPKNTRSSIDKVENSTTTTQFKEKGNIKDRINKFQSPNTPVKIQMPGHTRPLPASRNKSPSNSQHFPTTSENSWNAHNGQSPSSLRSRSPNTSNLYSSNNDRFKNTSQQHSKNFINSSNASHHLPSKNTSPPNGNKQDLKPYNNFLNSYKSTTGQPSSNRSIPVSNDMQNESSNLDSSHQIEEHTTPLHKLHKEVPPQPSGHDHLPLPLNSRIQENEELDDIYEGSDDDTSPKFSIEFDLPALPTKIRTPLSDGKISSPGNNITSKSRKHPPPPPVMSKPLNNNTKDVSRNVTTPIQTPQMPQEGEEYGNIQELLEKTISPQEKKRPTESALVHQAVPPPRLPRRPPLQNFLEIEGSNNRLPMTSLLRSLLNKDYFHSVNRAKAERLLTTEGMFLIRPSSTYSEVNPLSLCVYYSDSPQNFKINKRGDGSYALGVEKTNEMKFRAIDDLVENYKTHNLVFQIRNQSATVRLRKPPSKPH